MGGTNVKGNSWFLYRLAVMSTGCSSILSLQEVYASSS